MWASESALNGRRLEGKAPMPQPLCEVTVVEPPAGVVVVVAQQVVSALYDLFKVVGFDVRLFVLLVKLKAGTGLFFGTTL